MIPHALLQNFTDDLEAAAGEILAGAPEARDIVNGFVTLLRERQNLGIDSFREWAGKVFETAAFDAAAFGAGRPLLAGRELPGLSGCFADAAEKLLPAIGRAFPRLEPHASGLLSALRSPRGPGAQILGAVLAEDPRALRDAVDATGVPPTVLIFLATELLKPSLREAAQSLGPLADDDLWCKGYCPVCGAAPDFGLLKEKRDPSEYIVSKAGRLWLHCSLCGSVWRFVRLVCPSCGENGHDRLEVLTAAGREYERIHACLACRGYLLVIDLVERDGKIHPDLAPLGLLPLDVLARGRGFAPLARTPWNGLD